MHRFSSSCAAAVAVAVLLAAGAARADHWRPERVGEYLVFAGQIRGLDESRFGDDSSAAWGFAATFPMTDRVSFEPHMWFGPSGHMWLGGQATLAIPPNDERDVEHFVPFLAAGGVIETPDEMTALSAGVGIKYRNKFGLRLEARVLFTDQETAEGERMNLYMVTAHFFVPHMSKKEDD